MDQQDDESAHEAAGQPGDTPGQQPYPPYYQQPSQPGPQPFGGQPQQWGAQQQWYPGMPFRPYVPPSRGPGPVELGLMIGFGALMSALIVFGAVTAIAHANQSAHVAASNKQADANAPAASTPTGTQTAQVGSALTLAGLSAGEQARVIVTKVYDYAQPVDQYNEAPAGQRLFAVALRFEDTGSAEYSDSPGNSVTVYDSTGGSYQTGFDDVIECPSFQPVINVQVGASSGGCVVFDVPTNEKITKVQVTLDSGYGPQTGEWKIGSLSGADPVEMVPWSRSFRLDAQRT